MATPRRRSSSIIVVDRLRNMSASSSRRLSIMLLALLLLLERVRHILYRSRRRVDGYELDLPAVFVDVHRLRSRCRRWTFVLEATAWRSRRAVVVWWELYVLY